MPDIDTLVREYFDEIAPAVDVEAVVAERQLSPAPPARSPLMRSPLAIALATALLIIGVIGAVAVFSPLGEEPAPVTELPRPTTATTVEAAVETTGSPSTTSPPEAAPPVVGVDWVRVPHDEAVFGPQGMAIGDIVVGGRGLVAVGADTFESIPAVWTSTNGVSWSRVPYDEAVFGVPETLMHGVAVGGPGLVAIGSQCTADDVADFRCWVPVLWTSEDGTTWVRHPANETVFPPESFVTGVEPFAGGLVIVGATCREDPGCAPTVWTSRDGFEWVRQFRDEQLGEIVDVAAVGSGLVAVGYGSGPAGTRHAIWTSSDGSEWKEVTHDPDIFGGENEPGEIVAVAAGGPGVVAIGTYGPRDSLAVWTSTDGSAWRFTSQDQFGPEAIVVDVISDGRLLIAIGGNSEGGAVWTSVDGTSWQRVATLGGPEALTPYLDGLVAAGSSSEGAAVWMSPPP